MSRGHETALTIPPEREAECPVWAHTRLPGLPDAHDLGVKVLSELETEKAGLEVSGTRVVLQAGRFLGNQNALLSDLQH
jgi:hypothetical protein